MSDLMLDVGQANDLKLALRRARGSNKSEWTNAHITTLTQRDDILGQVLDIIEGLAKVVSISEEIKDSETSQQAPNTPPVLKSTKYTVDAEGNFHFTVTSNGSTPEQWITYFENEKKDAKGRPYGVTRWGKDVLQRATETPTNGVTYHIVVRPGKKIKSADRITRKIRAMAAKNGWTTPHWEVAPLIRDLFSDDELEQMGLWYIVTMHKPIEDSDRGPRLLYSNRGGDGRLLGADCDGPDDGWSDYGGFAFGEPVSQVVSPQTSETQPSSELGT